MEEKLKIFFCEDDEKPGYAIKRILAGKRLCD